MSGPTPCTPADLWPPFGLRIRSGDLVLTPVADDDLCGLADLARSGIHPPEAMPFDVPWTLAPPAALPGNMARYYWETRARFSAEAFHLDFAVRRAGVLVGVQGFHAEHFAVTRTAETGSWLALQFQGQGIGTRMRAAVCAFLIDQLGATQLTSGAFTDNPASAAVSRKLGYRPNGIRRHDRNGVLAVTERYLLDPGDLVRGDPVQVSGLEPLLAFLGLAPAA